MFHRILCSDVTLAAASTRTYAVPVSRCALPEHRTDPIPSANGSSRKPGNILRNIEKKQAAESSHTVERGVPGGFKEYASVHNRTRFHCQTRISWLEFNGF